MSEVDKRTVAIELAYNYRKGQLQQKGDHSPYNDVESKAREWAEQNCTEFFDEAERLLMKLQSPL
jgi:hypothetical protein